MNEKIIVALDTRDIDQARFLLKELERSGVWIKIGMEAFYALGSSIVKEAKDKNYNIFLDLKLHDIPNTVAKALSSISSLPVDMVNIHCAGGMEMMTRAAQTIKSLPSPPLLIGVTQLTSTTTKSMNDDQQILGEIEESVLHYAKMAQIAGLDGVVSSPLEIKKIKASCGQIFLTVTPGIRPIGFGNQDQKRVTSPQMALELGTDFIVIGRPITEAPSPRVALDEILKGLTK